MNMFKPSEAKTPEEYIALIDEPRRTEVKKLHDLIRKTIPHEEVKMWGSIIGYGNYHYKYASGKEGDWMVVGLASQKNYISVYVCATKNNEYVPESHKKDFPKASIGRSCIRFKKIDDIDLNVLKEVILEGVRETKNN